MHACNVPLRHICAPTVPLCFGPRLSFANHFSCKDSTDHERIPEAKLELNELLDDPDLVGVPFVVLGKFLNATYAQCLARLNKCCKQIRGEGPKTFYQLITNIFLVYCGALE